MHLVEDFSNLFQFTTSFNQNISDWDVSNATSFNMTLDGASTFNQDVSDWDVCNVATFYKMFDEATALNQPYIERWKANPIADFSNMFPQANEDIVAKFTTMPTVNDFYFGAEPAPAGSLQPADKTELVQALGDYFTDSYYVTVSNINGPALYGDINSCDVSLVDNFRSLFTSEQFNQDTSGRDVANLTNVELMFIGIILCLVDLGKVRTTMSPRTRKTVFSMRTELKTQTLTLVLGLSSKLSPHQEESVLLIRGLIAVFALLKPIKYSIIPIQSAPYFQSTRYRTMASEGRRKLLTYASRY